MSIRSALKIGGAASALALATATAGGAQTPRSFVRITVRDSTGALVPSAELTVTRGVHEVLAHGATDAGGHAVLPGEVKDSTDLQVTMRKIGYKRSDRFFEIGPNGTADVTLTVAPPRATDLGQTP